MNATRITETEWRLDGDGPSVRVFARPGASAEDVIAAHAEAIDGPSDPARRAEIARAEAVTAARAEVERRILKVVNRHAQMNMASTRAAGLMTDADAATHTAGLRWIWRMLEAYRAFRDGGDPPVWPDPPADLADLAARF